MAETMLSGNIQTADWQREKHVPVIDAPDRVLPDVLFDVTVTLGKEIAHPNATEHHIRWIALYFLPVGTKFVFQVAHVEFTAHGEAIGGANQGPVYANHRATVSMRTSQPGTLLAMAYCNIHGLWQSGKPLAVE
jgi:superoxide reductase